ncbi:MAG: hypothetical protein ABR553_06130 [Gammaproteobacteria bacterium]
MVKVYDMVTYELCDPAQDNASLDFDTPCAASAACLGLQQIEMTPATRREVLHPALHCQDVERFLAEFGD